MFDRYKYPKFFKTYSIAKIVADAYSVEENAQWIVVRAEDIDVLDTSTERTFVDSVTVYRPCKFTELETAIHEGCMIIMPEDLIAE